MNRRILPWLITLCAVVVSTSAAVYSVSGLTKLFAGGGIAVTIMAGALEASKLVIASLLYQYRKTLPAFLKAYLTFACIVLILITSMGIYGFLSSAYQQTANQLENTETQLTLLEQRKQPYLTRVQQYVQEKQSIDLSISELRQGLVGNKVQYRDSKTGEMIITTSTATRKALEKQLDQAVDRQGTLTDKIDELNQDIFVIDTEIEQVTLGKSTSGELGSLQYISKITGVSMDRVVNWLLLLIVFVFDPLAIALVIAGNYAFERLSIVETIYGEKKSREEVLDHPSPTDILDIPEEYRKQVHDIQMGTTHIKTKQTLLQKLRDRYFP